MIEQYLCGEIKRTWIYKRIKEAVLNENVKEW
jgi:hypothetical protein